MGGNQTELAVFVVAPCDNAIVCAGQVSARCHEILTWRTRYLQTVTNRLQFALGVSLHVTSRAF